MTKYKVQRYERFPHPGNRQNLNGDLPHATDVWELVRSIEYLAFFRAHGLWGLPSGPEGMIYNTAADEKTMQDANHRGPMLLPIFPGLRAVYPWVQVGIEGQQVGGVTFSDTKIAVTSVMAYSAGAPSVFDTVEKNVAPYGFDYIDRSTNSDGNWKLMNWFQLPPLQVRDMSTDIGNTSDYVEIFVKRYGKCQIYGVEFEPIWDKDTAAVMIDDS